MARLGALVRRHRGRLVTLARRLGLGPEDALDCVQDAFGTYLAWPGAPGPEAPEADVARVLQAMVRHAAANRRRRVRTARAHTAEGEEPDVHPGGTPPADAVAEAAEQVARLRVCVARLDDVQRAVVTLRLLDDLPGGDVARTLGLSPGHVAVLLHRARATLRDCMAAAG